MESRKRIATEELPASSNLYCKTPKTLTKRADCLKDVFQNEIIRSFIRMTDFKEFARAQNGLCLDECEIEDIIADNQSVLDQKMEMLNKWRIKNEKEATSEKIRSLAMNFQNGSDPEAGVVLAEYFSNVKRPCRDNLHLWSDNVFNDEDLALTQLLISNEAQTLRLLEQIFQSVPKNRPSTKDNLCDPTQLDHSDVSKDVMEPSMLGSSWKEILEEEFEKPYFRQLNNFVSLERKKYPVFPPNEEVFAWSKHCAVQDVKVVIVGKEPYPRPGLAHGLCFSIINSETSSDSLRNIFGELTSNVEELETRALSERNELTRWAQQGVLLLNTLLTVRENEPNSHREKGWEEFTDAVIKHISRECTGVVFMLWGELAQKKEKLICTEPHCDPNSEGNAVCSHMYGLTQSNEECTRRHCYQNFQGVHTTEPHHVLTAYHPNYYSLKDGGYPFLGCRHFLQANEIMKRQRKRINW